MRSQKFSFAVTAFNEMSKEREHGTKILACIKAAQQHDQIDEIVIVDDASEDFETLEKLLVGEDKVRLTSNLENQGVFGNKLEAIAQCRRPWVITCDSDNVMDKTYLDTVGSLSLASHVWYCPSFAKPKFDYRKLEGYFSINNIGAIASEKIFACCMNTGNQIVHCESFMEVFSKYRLLRADLKLPNYRNLDFPERGSKHNRLVFNACDSFIFNLEWLLAGNVLRICPSLEYDHCYATGEASSYARAPKEKGELAAVLLKGLLSACGGTPR